jgi:hypothetical protein
MLSTLSNRRYRPVLALSVVTFTCLVLSGPVYIDPLHPAQTAIAQDSDSSSSSSSDGSSADSGSSDSSSGDTGDVNTSGTVRVNNLANLEALLNIFCNLLEIWGLGNSGSFLGGSIVSFVMKHYIVGAILLIMTPIALIGGIAAPGIVNWFVASARDANTPEVVGVLAIGMPVFFLIMLMGFGFMPTAIAFARRHPQKWLIMLSTLVSWIVPFGWPALLFWAYYDPKSSATSTAI